MAHRVVIEGFPPDVLKELKMIAARDGTSVKALLVDAARQLVGSTIKARSSESPARATVSYFRPDPKSGVR